MIVQADGVTWDNLGGNVGWKRHERDLLCRADGRADWSPTASACDRRRRWENLVDDFTSASVADTLNGGAGNDTYSISFGDGVDIINELPDRSISIAGQSARGSGRSDRPRRVRGTTGAGNDNLVIQFNGQQATVTDHFDTAGEAVEAITFNGSTFEGYVLAGDYALNRDGTADAGVNTAFAGTTGNNTITGNSGFDLLFGNAGNDTLNGGLGEDLLVGGTGNDDNLTLTGTAAINGTGNALDNDMDGNAGDNQLFGGGGNDNIDGGDGSDLVEGAEMMLCRAGLATT